MKKSDYAKKVCGLILLLIVIVSLFVGVVSAEGIITDNTTIEDARVPQLAPRNPDFLAYLENPPEATYGYIQPPMDLSHLDLLPVVGLPTLYALPSSFDWRDQGGVTPVKDQNYCGTCWDFGTTSVLESAVLIDESVAHDFSEQSVALCVDRSWYYLYDGSTDPCQAGGWSCLASEVFIKKGSVLETCNPYECSSLNCDGSCVCDICPPVKKVDGYRLATNDGSQIEVIKNAVYNHGPVTMAFYYTPGGGYSVEPWGIIYDYYPCSGSANHLVSIIGWVDAVPHPNPSHAGTGAWIVKNSWGTGWGNEGFFYLAYDSSCVEEIAYLKYKNYNPGEELLYWDEAGHVGSMGYGDNSAWMANLFTATQSGDLTHVDFWTTSNNAQYELYVWNGFFGTELAYQTGNCQEYGYYSIPLSESLSIDAGQQFTVGIRMTTPSYDYPIPIEYKITGWVDPPIQTSVSFIRHTASGTWTDLANYDRNACLRARLTILVPPECDGSDTSCGIYPNCENCNDYDGCYEYGDGCEERDYYCESNEAGCNYIYSNRHTDYYDDFVNYCKSDEVWKHRLFHNFYCESGTCVDHTSWVDDQLVENCSDRDGWVDTGNTRWVDDPGNVCKEKEQKEQEYHDYSCSGGNCTYSATETQWVDTGNTRNKPDILQPISPLSFGDVIVGNSLDKTTTIYNDCTAILTVNSITRSSGSSDFSYIGPSTPFDIAAGSSRTITVRFAPTSTGSKSANFNVNSNDPDEANVPFSVSGDGTPLEGEGTYVAYLKRGPCGDCDYDLYIYTAPTTLTEHGTLTASDYWSPDGSTVAITAIDIDGDGIDEIAYLKRGPYGDCDYDLYIYTAPTTLSECGTLTASDLWAPDGQTEAISAIW